MESTTLLIEPQDQGVSVTLIEGGTLECDCEQCDCEPCQCEDWILKNDYAGQT